jgi:hypothetical protein
VVRSFAAPTTVAVTRTRTIARSISSTIARADAAALAGTRRQRAINAVRVPDLKKIHWS